MESYKFSGQWSMEFFLQLPPPVYLSVK